MPISLRLARYLTGFESRDIFSFATSFVGSIWRPGTELYWERLNIEQQ